MLENYKRRYKKYFEKLGYFGMWPDDQRPSPWWFKFYQLVVQFFLLGLYNSSCIAEWVVHGNSFRSVASVAYVSVSSVTAQIKLLLIIGNRRRFARILDVFEIDSFRERNPREAKIIEDGLWYFQTVAYVMIGTVFSAETLMVVLPLFVNSQRHRLPAPLWLPFNTSAAPYHQLIYLYETIASYLCAIGYSFCDVLLTGNLIFVGTQCKVLALRLESIGKEKNGREKGMIADCIHHHWHLLSYMQQINDLFGTICFCQIASCTLALCMDLFLLNITKRDSPDFFYLTVYNMAITSSLLFPCWFGTETIRKSEEITTAIYNSNWPDLDEELKKDLMYLLHVSQEPLKLYAMKYFEISIVTFVGIYRAAVGYCAVMRNLNDTEPIDGDRNSRQSSSVIE